MPNPRNPLTSFGGNTEQKKRLFLVACNGDPVFEVPFGIGYEYGSGAALTDRCALAQLLCPGKLIEGRGEPVVINRAFLVVAVIRLTGQLVSEGELTCHRGYRPYENSGENIEEVHSGLTRTSSATAGGSERCCMVEC